MNKTETPPFENLLSRWRYTQMNWWLRHKAWPSDPELWSQTDQILPPSDVRLWASSLACLNHGFFICKIRTNFYLIHGGWTQGIAFGYYEVEKHSAFMSTSHSLELWVPRVLSCNKCLKARWQVPRRYTARTGRKTLERPLSQPWLILQVYFWGPTVYGAQCVGTWNKAKWNT